MHSWSAFLPAVLLGAGAVLTTGAGRQHAAPLARPLADLPSVVDGASAHARELTADERRVAGVTDYSFRLFRRDTSNAFSVYVGYYESQSTGRTIHSPRNCLPGSGWQVVESGTAPIPVTGSPVEVNRYVIANGDDQAVVLYWYQGRGRVAHSEYRVKWDLLRDAATRGRTEEALVRVMVPIPPTRGFSESDWAERRREAEAQAVRVARELVPALDAALPGWDPSG